MSDELPQILFLNGTSSTGKTSIARELQERLPEPFLRVALDQLFDMVPKPWSGGRGGPLSLDGFYYDETSDEATPLVTKIRYGSTGRRILWGFHAAVAALADQGNHIIVDTIVLDAAEAADWRQALRRSQVFVVSLRASLAALEERERKRCQRAGLARGHLDAVDVIPFDVSIDTTSATLEQLAQQILDRLGVRRPRPSR